MEADTGDPDALILAALDAEMNAHMAAEPGDLDPLVLLDAEMETHLVRRERRRERLERLRVRAALTVAWTLILSPVWWRWMPWM